uniref:GPI alpha-1,4-mannosyltransferase I, catalytic subunit n=1 Tax=Heterorhabditis bacteriophora TaxID=37862 RepID=A0A1I7XI36_HETBA
MGALKIEEDGIRIHGRAQFDKPVHFSQLSTTKDEALTIDSFRGINMQARNASGHVSAKITIGSDGKAQAVCNRFEVLDPDNRLLFFADSDEIGLKLENLRILDDGGSVFEGAIQTAFVRPEPDTPLRLESPTRSVSVDAAQDIELMTSAGEVRINSLLDTSLTSKQILFIAFAARLTLVLYSNIHDYIFKVSLLVRRMFYLMVFICCKVILHYFLPGKILFCSFDIFVGWLLLEMNAKSNSNFQTLTSPLKRNENIRYSVNGDNFHKMNEVADSFIEPVVVFWLANPLTAVISARGNADVLVCAAVLFTLYLIQRNQWVIASFVYGSIAVHLKIYPLIYLPSIFLHLAKYTNRGILSQRKKLLTNWRGFTFIAITVGSLYIILLSFYHVYGDQFLNEFLLYHIKRRDIRHNFSLYFYLLYLVDGHTYLSETLGFLAFFPQIIMIVYFASSINWILSQLELVSNIYLRVVRMHILNESNPLFSMVFYLIGLGLGDVEDITVKGLNAIRQCRRVYLEAYTSILCYGLEKSRLESFYEKEVIEADRTMVEQNSDDILSGADDYDVAMLVVGDPFGATTHADLVLRAKEKNIPVPAFNENTLCVGRVHLNFLQSLVPQKMFQFI